MLENEIKITQMKKYSFKIRGHKYDVEILKAEKKTIELEVNGSVYTVELDQEVETSKTPKLVRPEVPTQKKIKKDLGDTGSMKVRCPLPGNIMHVFVNNGDVVKKGDKLVMYEAMKMENTVFADRDGKVSNVSVKVGDTILQNELLMEIS